MELKFGKFKGLTVEEAFEKEGGLSWLMFIKGKVDVNDAKFGKQNRALVAEIDRVCNGKPKEKVFEGTKPQAVRETVTTTWTDTSAKAPSDRNYQALLNIQKVLIGLEEKIDGLRDLIVRRPDTIIGDEL